MPRHDIPDRASKAELDEIARQLRASLPPIEDRRTPLPSRRPAPPPLPAPRVDPVAMLRFIVAFTLPGLLLVVLALIVNGAS